MTAVNILERFIALDFALSHDGVHTESFAKEWKVHVRTIRRDLDALRKLGQSTESRQLEDGTYRHTYQGSRPLFTANLSPKK